jgi:hypothetical protein
MKNQRFTVTIELQTIEIHVAAKNKTEAKKKALEKLKKKSHYSLIETDYKTNRKKIDADKDWRY